LTTNGSRTEETKSLADQIRELATGTDIVELPNGGGLEVPYEHDELLAIADEVEDLERKHQSSGSLDFSKKENKWVPGSVKVYEDGPEYRARLIARAKATGEAAAEMNGEEVE